MCYARDHEVLTAIGGEILASRYYVKELNFAYVQIVKNQLRVYVPAEKWNDPPRLVSEMRITSLPGNGEVQVCHDVNVWPPFNGKGLGNHFLQRRDSAYTKLGIGMVLVTARTDNPIEIHLLEKNFYVRATTFKSLWDTPCILYYKKFGKVQR